MNNLISDKELREKMNEFEAQIAKKKAQIAKKTDEIQNLNKELEKYRLLAATNYNEYIGKIVKIEMTPCTYRYIRVISITMNKDDLPVLHGTGFDKTVLLIKSTTSFSSSDTQWTLTPNTDFKEISEDEFEKIKQEEIAKLSKL